MISLMVSKNLVTQVHCLFYFLFIGSFSWLSFTVDICFAGGDLHRHDLYKPAQYLCTLRSLSPPHPNQRLHSLSSLSLLPHQRPHIHPNMTSVYSAPISLMNSMPPLLPQLLPSLSTLLLVISFKKSLWIKQMHEGEPVRRSDWFISVYQFG